MIGRHKFSVGKNFEVENFQLLTIIFSENFLSVEIFLSGNGPQSMVHTRKIRHFGYRASFSWLGGLDLTNLVYTKTR